MKKFIVTFLLLIGLPAFADSAPTKKASKGYDCSMGITNNFMGSINNNAGIIMQGPGVKKSVKTSKVKPVTFPSFDEISSTKTLIVQSTPDTRVAHLEFNYPDQNYKIIYINTDSLIERTDFLEKRISKLEQDLIDLKNLPGKFQWRWDSNGYLKSVYPEDSYLDNNSITINN